MKVAEQAVAQGAEIVLTNAPVAMRMGAINELAAKCNAPVIPADATSEEDLKNLFEGAMEHFGGKIDFVLHSIGMSPNVRKGKHYTDINYKFLETTLDVSVISPPKPATAKADANNEWGLLLLLHTSQLREFSLTMVIWLTPNLFSKVFRSFGYHYGCQKRLE